MSYILTVLSLIFALSLSFFDLGTDKKILKQKPFYFAPPKLIKYFSFGFSDLYADILWMRLIQDIDFCSSKKGQPIYDGKTKYTCEKGWSYKMTSAITELAPRFLQPYEISGSIMSVITKDKIGAKKIYDKGIKNFPNNWNLHFQAGYHYLLELKNEEKAAKLLARAANLGGPFWLYTLAAQTYEKIGKLKLSQAILVEAIKKDVSEQYKTTLELKLKKVEQEIKKLNLSLTSSEN